ncbi:Coenzyme F420 hydrogenase/dehydrogenase, beta subunit C-terminal domain [Sporanaerobacter acetigenes]|uniref:Coenzyme F420 hydrogenase/dehydrogenase, beta subunit C-terminal domain n=1 Tax=Sporanaerobacter acetigenes TaxID=165813 RepID=UPI003320E410
MIINNVSVIDKKDCTGCGVCHDVCSFQAIEFREDEEGFLYPSIDKNRCTNCGKCLKKCQINYDEDTSTQKLCYIAYNKNDVESEKSTSGGVFPLITKYVLEKKGYICGAIIRNNDIFHIISNDNNDLQLMQGSKYGQSNLKNIYNEIKDKLNRNILCLFSGTPCQVNGLKIFLGKEYDNLICVDIVCHGVPNNKLLKDDLSHYGTKYNVLSFREKTKNNGTLYRMQLKDTENNTIKKVYSTDSLYFNAFMNSVSLRESCYRCKFAKMSRVGDVTLGDSAYSKNYSQLDPSKIVSLVLINNAKGNKVWKQISCDINYFEGDFEKEIRENKQLNRPSLRPNLRDEFYKDYYEKDYVSVCSKYKKKITSVSKIKRYVKSFIPIKYKLFIKKKLRRK